MDRGRRTAGCLKSDRNCLIQESQSINHAQGHTTHTVVTHPVVTHTVVTHTVVTHSGNTHSGNTQTVVTHSGNTHCGNSRLYQVRQELFDTGVTEHQHIHAQAYATHTVVTHTVVTHKQW